MVRNFLRTAFFTNYVAFTVLGLLLVLYLPKGVFFLMINNHHNVVSDLFFKYATYLGDGLFFLVVVVALLFYRYYYAVVAAVISLVEALTMLLFKQWLFDGTPRPKAFFSEHIDVHIIDGVDVHSFNSFPSGHTATAFAIFAMFAMFFGTRSQTTGILFFLLACIAGYSRIHLSQHFLIDVYFGSMVGVASVLAGVAITDKLLSSKKDLLMERSLVRSR